MLKFITLRLPYHSLGISPQSAPGLKPATLKLPTPVSNYEATAAREVDCLMAWVNQPYTVSLVQIHCRYKSHIAAEKYFSNYKVHGSVLQSTTVIHEFSLLVELQPNIFNLPKLDPWKDQTHNYNHAPYFTCCNKSSKLPWAKQSYRSQLFVGRKKHAFSNFIK